MVQWRRIRVERQAVRAPWCWGRDRDGRPGIELKPRPAVVGQVLRGEDAHVDAALLHSAGQGGLLLIPGERHEAAHQAVARQAWHVLRVAPREDAATDREEAEAGSGRQIEEGQQDAAVRQSEIVLCPRSAAIP